MGKPASITSTPRRASWWAISSFSGVLSEIPGDCSPSRRVVSKISTRLGSGDVVVMSLLLSRPSRLLGAGFAALRPPRVIPPEGGEGEAGEGSAGAPSAVSVAAVVAGAQRITEPRGTRDGALR